MTVRAFIFLLLLPFVWGCSITLKQSTADNSVAPYRVNQTLHNHPLPPAAVPTVKPILYQKGIASYYARRFKGLKTASGERYDPKLLTAASRTLPINSRVLVQSLSTNQSVIVRINDRGPYIKSRIIDLSEAAAKEIGLYKKGLARVYIYLFPNKK